MQVTGHSNSALSLSLGVSGLKRTNERGYVSWTRRESSREFHDSFGGPLEHFTSRTKLSRPHRLGDVQIVQRTLRLQRSGTWWETHRLPSGTINPLPSPTRVSVTYRSTQRRSNVICDNREPKSRRGFDTYRHNHCQMCKFGQSPTPPQDYGRSGVDRDRDTYSEVYETKTSFPVVVPKVFPDTVREHTSIGPRTVPSSRVHPCLSTTNPLRLHVGRFVGPLSLVCPLDTFDYLRDQWSPLINRDKGWSSFAGDPLRKGRRVVHTSPKAHTREGVPRSTQ